MPSIIAAIKQAADEITMYREGTGWILSQFDPTTGNLRTWPSDAFWAVQERCRVARIGRALALLGLDSLNADRYAHQREGTYSKVVREVMRERAGKAA